MQTGTRLRNLFATLLLFCEPTRPGQLWLEFRANICDDLRRRLETMGRRPTEDDTYDYGLFLLNKILNEQSRSLRDFPSMPMFQIDWDAHVDNPLIAEQLDYDKDLERTRAEHNIALLNDEQKTAFDKIMQSLNENLGKTFFLNGPGGTGKTFVYKTACHQARSQEIITLCSASSGIAALLMPSPRHLRHFVTSLKFIKS